MHFEYHTSNSTIQVNSSRNGSPSRYGPVIYANADKFHLVYHTWDGTTDGGKAKTYIGGLLDQLDTAFDLESSAGSYNTAIGARNLTSAQVRFGGDIAEILIFNAELPLQDKNRLDRYLNFKYSLSLNAPTKLCITDAGTPDQVLLLHSEGPNGESDILDSSDSGHTITSTGVTHDTSEKPFGFSSMEFNGTSDYLTVPDSTDFYFTGDGTIEFWMYPRDITRGGITDQPIFERGVEPGTQAAGRPKHRCRQNNQVIQWYHEIDAFGDAFSAVTGNVITEANRWYHIALVRSGTNVKIYVNGKEEASATEVAAPGTLSGDIKIGRGRYDNGTNWAYFDGLIKEFRWVNGTALYTENFKPKKNFYCDN
jgi:hypothetical protein